MPYNPDKHHRRSIRLEGYDYSQSGAYFVTICTHNKVGCLAAITSDSQVAVNHRGHFVHQCWLDLPNHYPNIDLDEFTLMPNHIHGIIILSDGNSDVGAGLRPALLNPNPSSKKPQSLPEIIRAFKSFSARRINELQHTPGNPFWQRDYCEHIIRSERELNRVREYIYTNPERWERDDENPDVRVKVTFPQWLVSSSSKPDKESGAQTRPYNSK